MRFGFPRAGRLRLRRDYLAVQGTGSKLGGKHFLLLVGAGLGRVGITVSKKVGNAVTRNRIKRLVREHVRRAPTGYAPAGRDVVVIARPSAAGLGLLEVAAELDRLRSRM